MKTLILFFLGTLISIGSWAQVRTANLTAEYKFKSGSLTDKVSGTTLVRTGTALAGTPDRANGVNTDRAISLNGDHLQRTAGTTGNNFSISFWIKTSTNDAAKRVIIDQSERALESEGATETGWYVYLLNGKIGLAGNFEWYRWNTSGYQGWYNINTTTDIADGQWHHITITNHTFYESRFVGGEVVGNRYNIYIDNTLRVTQTAEKALGAVTGSTVRRFITAVTPITIGNSKGGNSANRFTEAIDDIRYYNAVLPASDVTPLYNEPGCAGVTGITMLTQNIDITLDATGNATITPSDIDNGSINSCSEPVTLSLSKTAFTCDDLGQNAVTLYAEDADGNQGDATVTVTVSPALEMQNITVQLDASGNTTIAAEDVVDTCPSLTLSLDVTDFTCADLGANTVTVTADDGNGNTISATATVTVVDALAPVAVAQNISVQINPGTGTAIITDEMIDNGSSDNCSGVLTLSLSTTLFTCSQVGENTVVLTVEDESGNTATANATVTVTSFINDEVITSAGADFCPDGTSGATVSMGSSAVGIDYYLRNSANNVVVDGPIAGTGGALDFATGNLNQTTTFNVFANAEIDAEVTGNALDFDGVNDKVEIPYTNQLLGTTAFTIEAWINPTKTTYSRIVTRFSGSGNTAGDVVFDMASPTNNGRGLRLYMVKSNATHVAISVDNVLTLNSWNHVAATFNSGVMTLYVNGIQVATGAFGESSLVAASGSWVIGEDRGGTNPEFFKGKIDEVRFWNIARTVGEIQSNMNSCLSVNTPGLTAYYTFDEDAGIILPDKTSNANTGNLLNMDAGTDWVEGASITCQTNCGFQLSTEITIGDNTPPTAVTQNITLQLDGAGIAILAASTVNNGSSDNCTATEALVLSVDKTTFVCDDLGENTVTLTVTDAAGNEATTTATVTLEDIVEPTAVSQTVTLQLDTSGNATLTPAAVNNGSSDNCTAQQDLLLSIDKTTFACDDLGENTVTLTVSDASGNEATTTATVVVTDATAPTALTQNITLQLDASGNATLAASEIGNGSSDVCSSVTLSLDKTTFSCSDLGENTVNLTVTDASNNQSTATATITVVDLLAPVVTTQNLTIDLGEDGVATITAADVNDGSADNCTATGSLTLSLDISSFTVANVGDNIVTLTVTDASGNIGTGTAIVTVEDREQQTITFGVLEEKTFGDDSFELTATASSTLEVSYTSSNENVAVIDGTTVTIVGAGSTTIIATQAGNDDFYQATSAEQILTVQKASQSITFEPSATVNFTTGSIVLEATSSVSLPITFSSSNEAIAIVSNNTLSFIAPGVVEVTANQAGTDNYNAAMEVVSITIADDRQTILLSGSLDFGNVLQNEMEQRSFIIANGGNAALQVTSITLPQGFTSSINTATVPANSNVSVTITFAPMEARDYSGSVIVASNAVSGTNEINISGTGVTITGFNEPSQPTGELDVYPNPSNGLFTLKGKFSAGKYVSITGLSGKTQQRALQQKGEDTHTLDITDLPQGVYYLKVEEKNSVAVKQIVKIN